MSFRPYLRPLKRTVNRGFEWLWGMGFAVYGRAMRSHPTRWSTPGGRKVLVVAPHPDDEAIGCAGTLLLHSMAGDRVCIAIATDGRRSRVIPDPDQMAAERKREAGEAASLMKADRLDWLGHPEGEYTSAALTQSLFALLNAYQPDLIYAPSRIDFHPEHMQVAHALAVALSDPGATYGRVVRIYQVQVPLTSPVCNLVCDVSAVAEQCAAVLAAYASQAGTLQSTLRQRRYRARVHGFAKEAEEFWEVPASRYIALHCTTPQQWPSAFRGLRSLSLSDPLAYLVGRSERRRLLSVG